jgi:hypothetical protein
MSHVPYSSHSAIITEDDYIKGGYHPVHLFSDGK